MKTYIAEKLEHLRAETLKLRALAEELTNKPQMSADDRRVFEQYLSLIDEIQDYGQRLQKPGEKWRICA